MRKTVCQVGKALILGLFIGGLRCQAALAQSGVNVRGNVIERPARKFVFAEDAKKAKEAEKSAVKRIIQVDAAASSDVDLKAGEVEFHKDTNEVIGAGGVLISGQGVQIEAESGALNLDTNEAQAAGDVLLTHRQGVVQAEAVKFNIETETGEFFNARFAMEEGGYQVASEKVFKLSETKYRLFNSVFSTCHCADGSQPWQITSDECRITQEGYAHSYNSRLEMYGMPVFYSPYLGFPAKTERASGLLVPELGYSRRHGAIARVPLFVVWDDSSDSIFTPFIETQTRNGLSFDYRHALSRDSNVESRVIYSNERPRGDDLQGTITSGMADPAFDKDRWGGFYDQRWRSSRDSWLDAGLVADVRYISDNLFLREMEDDRIGDPQSQYAISSIVGRTVIGDLISAEIGGEYNQAIVNDQDTTLQKLPELRLDAMRSFRPFGFNPLGLKLVTRLPVVITDFSRQEGYDGWRTNIGPSLSVPVRYGGFFNSTFGVGVLQTYYNLRERFDPRSQEELESSAQRTLPSINYAASTALERVYEVSPDSWLTYLSALGAENQANSLARVKHQIEPFFRYNYVPQVSQGGLPFFDSSDRQRQRSLFTYGFSTSILGRFVPRRGSGDDIAELTPRPEDLPVIGSERPLGDFGMFGEGLDFPAVRMGRGQIRELAVLSLRQSYDYIEAQKDLDPDRNPYSDIGMLMELYPSSYFGLAFDTNYSPYDNNLSSWGVSAAARDDRGDVLRLRTTYQRDSISQMEANLEIALTERWKFGGYTRFDEREREFIENRLALRLSSACDCWHFDVGLRDTVNPDKQSVLVSFAFGGLGNVMQSFVVNRAND